MRIESLLAARLFLAPQLVQGTVYFLSDLSGRLSLYRMAARPGGSVPEPLLPPHLALQNPHLVDGYSFRVFPKLDKILLMLDRDGDENYQPMLVPTSGGFPEPAFEGQLEGYRVHAAKADLDQNVIYFVAESRREAKMITFRGRLAENRLEQLAESQWGLNPDGVSDDHRQLILIEGYTPGDTVLHWLKDGEKRLLFGTPIEARNPAESYPVPAFFSSFFVDHDRGVLLGTALFTDTYGLGYIDLTRATPAQVQPVTITGQRHSGDGEFKGLEHLKDNLFTAHFNIDGVSWLYEAAFDAGSRELRLQRVLAGEGAIGNGVLESAFHEKESGTHVLTYSTATTPTQIYTIGGPAREQVVTHTAERVLGIPREYLSDGEDASFTSHDGLRNSARLYLPAAPLGFKGPRPLVYYIHGGPQSQERPDFAWFSMPLIQFLTLNGFAVFVPNARGSTGYGLKYMKQVDRDWGGADRLDHVHAITEVLPKDRRVDASRAGVVGRSYGGYMTLTLAARHPGLWAAAIDMFGPYDLLSFGDRIPPTWKPYFRIALGDPETDRDFLVERSPATYIEQISCPLLVIQGKNDPRVVEPESRDVVERLRGLGKNVDYLVFENEGHDVLKFENRVRCYNAITGFFMEHLKP